MPGNAGTSNIAENINIDIEDFNQIKKIVLEKKIDLIIIGPEKPLGKWNCRFFRKKIIF